MTPSLAQSPALSVLISLLWMTLGCFRYHRMPPKVSIAWSTRHMSAARWLLAPTCIRRASTRSCRKRWRRPLLTDCCTMLTWLSPVGIASAWLRPPPAKASNRSNERSMRRDIRRTQLLVVIRLLKHQWHSPPAGHPTSEIPGRRRQINKPASSPHCARTRQRHERPARRTRQTPRLGAGCELVHVLVVQLSRWELRR